jgi:hypothetical protein
MKKYIFILILIYSINVLAYQPPVYIANPNTLECKYYFAGDTRHFNPRPENFTITLGPTTNFKDVDDACNQWKCFVSMGTWDANNERCICIENFEWTERGCIGNNKPTNNPVIKNKSLLTYDRLIMVLIIMILLVYIFRNKTRRKK